MTITLIKNIAVIIVNNEDGLVDQDKILDCIALDTAYKIHVLVEDKNENMLDGWRKLSDILDFIRFTNNNRPVYVHYKRFHLMDLNFIRELCSYGFKFDWEETLHVGEYIFSKNKKGYYTQVKLPTITV